MVLLYGTFINLKNFGVDQSFVQRYITAKSDQDARNSVWIGTLMFPIVSVLFFFIGTGLFSLYHSDSELLDEVRHEEAVETLKSEGLEVTPEATAAMAASLKDTDFQDKVLPHFIVRKLPVGIAGLLIAAIFAAAMSSVDTSLNSSATLVLCDIVQPHVNPDISERQSMRVLYAATLIFGAVGTTVAVAMINVDSALDTWWILEGIFSGGMLGLFLLGILSRRAGNPQAIFGGVSGLLIIAWMVLSTQDFWPAEWSGWSNPLHKFMTIVVGTTAIVILGMFAALISGKTPETSD